MVSQSKTIWTTMLHNFKPIILEVFAYRLEKQFITTRTPRSIYYISGKLFPIVCCFTNFILQPLNYFLEFL